MFKNKTNNVIGMVIISLSIAVILGIIYYSYLHTMQNPHRYLENKEGIGKKLYTKIMSYDDSENYPKTPEEVMDLFIDTTHMIYGKIILDESLYEEILKQQRMIYAEEILLLNSYENQYNELINQLKEMEDRDTYSISIAQKSPIYEIDDMNVCYITIVHKLKGMEDEEVEYILKKNNANQWKIVGVLE